MSENNYDSLRVLLADTVDYAGLFPPSQVSMKTAVENYAAYLKSENSWMIGRFITPVSNLDKFKKEFESVRKEGDEIWKTSVIIADDFERNLGKVKRFNQKNQDCAVIETVEIKVNSSEEIKQVAHVLPDNLICYFEVPSSIVLTEMMTAIALTKTRAKIRTGGITPEAFPPIDEIVKFMRVCTAANVPFKATAGLHHPLRCHKPLTYEENAVKGAMNGFLNLFLAAVFLRQNLNHTFVHELMKDSDAGNFRFTNDGVSWKNHTATISEIESARKRGIISFGSCSFTEPIEDLQEIGLL